MLKSSSKVVTDHLLHHHQNHQHLNGHHTQLHRRPHLHHLVTHVLPLLLHPGFLLHQLVDHLLHLARHHHPVHHRRLRLQW